MQRGQPNPRRHDKQTEISTDEFEYENEASGASEEELEFEFEAARNGHGGDRYGRRLAEIFLGREIEWTRTLGASR